MTDMTPTASSTYPRLLLWDDEPWTSLIAALDDDSVPCPPVDDVPAYEVRLALPTLTGTALTRTLRGKKLVRAALAYVEAHPEEHEQGDWRCASGMCLAGWAASLLPTWEWADRLGRNASYSEFLVRVIRDGRRLSEEQIARAHLYSVGTLFYEELGLDEGSATGDALVDGHNTLADLKVLVDQFLRDLPLVRPTRNHDELEEVTAYDDGGHDNGYGGTESYVVWSGACWWADRDLTQDTVRWDDTVGHLIDVETGTML